MEDNFRKVLEEAEKLTNKSYTGLDTSFLVDLLLEMSNDFKDSVIEWTTINISHRLKLELSTAQYLRNSWKNTVERTIDKLQLKFDRNPTLKLWLQDNFDVAWKLAVKEYKRAQREYSDLPDIPYTDSPWSLDDILVYFD